MILNRRRLLSDRASLGRWGEKRCERFLRNKGMRTLIRNYSCKLGELDLVMVDSDGALVFVEVRTRAGEQFVPAEATVNATKRERVSKAARHFIATHRIEDRPLRFDVVTLILGHRGPPQIRHYENAFVP
jgi:putative endonuclease